MRDGRSARARSRLPRRLNDAASTSSVSLASVARQSQASCFEVVRQVQAQDLLLRDLRVALDRVRLALDFLVAQGTRTPR